MADEMPRSSAKALLLTVLGEFVLPSGGEVWTSRLLAAADALGVTEKTARQAIARTNDDGIIEPVRHGRRVCWTLTPSGTQLLEAGTERIYGLGRSSATWNGEWLVTHCPVPESQRRLRQRLRSRLAFDGFGELSPSLFASPHVDRQPLLRHTLDELGLTADSVTLRSRTASPDDDADLVRRGWPLDDLAVRYERFEDRYRAVPPVRGGVDAFRALVHLVDEWRHYPFIDPELPAELLPDEWAGARAAETFHARHRELAADAIAWFGESE